MGKPRLKDLECKTSTYSAYAAYAAAKLYNIFFTRSLAVKHGPKGITAFALNPGLVSTNFGEGLTGTNKTIMWLMRPFMTTPEQGAQTTVHLATAPRIDAKSGKYFKNMKVSNTSSKATDDAARNTLWAISIEMTAPYL